MHLRTVCGLAIVLICLTGCRKIPSGGSSLPSAESSQPAGAVIEVAAEGDPPRNFGSFEFVVPAGWSIVKPDREKTKSMLILDGTSWQDAKAMIKVDRVESDKATDQVLAAVGPGAGGGGGPASMKFDGTNAVMNSTDSNDLGKPRNTITIFRHPHVYFVMAGASEGVDVSEAIEAIRSSWKWTE